jgi:hypothetical protein
MFSSILFILGIIFISASFFFGTTSQIIYSSFLLIGIVLIITGIFIVILRSKRYVYGQTDKSVTRQVYYVKKEQEEMLKKLLSQQDFSAAPCKFEESGNFKIEVLTSSDRRFSAGQLFEYHPFNFYAVTPLYCYENEQSEKLLSFLDNCKKKQ